MLQNFESIHDRLKQQPTRPVLGVVAANDENTIEGALEAAEAGLVRPLLIGDADVIEGILKDMGKTCDILDVKDPADAAKEAVRLVREGNIQILMKGHIETGPMLKAVVDKENGIGTGKLMTHIAFLEIPNYHKLLAVTDGGMFTYPDLETKKGILTNAVECLRALGVEKPKIACLAAIEKVNPKMPETVDADALKKMYETGELGDCVVEGPISFDLAYSKEAAEIKHYDSPVAGDADVMLVPNIHVGNILAKSMNYAAEALFAGVVYGAKVPIVLTSRSSGPEEKFNSIAIAALLGASS